MEKLYNYIFWYNHYEGVWYAVHRDYQLEFFNGNRDKTRYMKSTQHSTLVELICRQTLPTELN